MFVCSFGMSILDFSVQKLHVGSPQFQFHAIWVTIVHKTRSFRTYAPPGSTVLTLPSSTTVQLAHFALLEVISPQVVPLLVSVLKAVIIR